MPARDLVEVLLAEQAVPLQTAAVNRPEDVDPGGLGHFEIAKLRVEPALLRQHAADTAGVEVRGHHLIPGHRLEAVLTRVGQRLLDRLPPVRRAAVT